MQKIVVTGGSGKAGRAVVADLLEHGYDVLNVDVARPAESKAAFLSADLTDLGQTIDALKGAYGVVHLAAIPAPGMKPDGVTFDTNTISTYNIFSAAVTLGLQRVVWASSETTLGLPFDTPPDYAPIDEAHTLRPESTYALSKVVGEEMARQFSRWSGIPFVALRFSNIMERHDYERFPTFWDDPMKRKWNLWSYVDASHVAQSCRLGLEADIQGAESFIIAAGDNVMNLPSRDLMAEVFPGVPVRDDLGEFETLLGIDKARRMLGYDPTFTWRSLGLG
jgi:nucleoside-diphosphate-sugar epimerase